jgi:N-acylglucosamine 2-epimerase
MDREFLRQLKGFYESELTNWILPFWMERSIDSEHGGFFNCFDNSGAHLLSRINTRGVREDSFGCFRGLPT